MLRRHLRFLALALALAACAANTSADEITYVDPGKLSIFSIPNNWNLYEFKDLSSFEQFPFTASVEGLAFPVISGAGFSAAPSRRPEDLGVPLAEADYPIGATAVRQVSADARERLSRFVLTQSVIPYRSFPDMYEFVSEDFSFGAGYDGVRRLVRYVDPDNPGSIAAVYMLAVTDPADQRMYSMVVGCSESCFSENQAAIERVVDSWIVNVKN